MSHHGVNELPGLAQYRGPGHHEDHPDGRFGRMFPHLAANYVPAPLLTLIGEQGGPMDGGSASDRTLSVPAGQVIFGQFIDHDITLDTTSSLDGNQRAVDTPNVRTPTLDLDCIYGDGPESHPYLYRDGIRLHTGEDVPGATIEQQNDLLRAPNGRAIIGDHRNDENRILSQMQLAMIRLHNDACDALSATASGHDLYEAARRHVTWHYQWCVVFDFLVAMCGRSVVEDILGRGRKLYCHVTRPYIPIEFAAAAYRFGHSMVPMRIQVQKGGPNFEFFGPQLGDGFTAVTTTSAIVDWHELFDTAAGRSVQRADKLDTKLATDLLALPFITAPSERSLATRNLLRGNVFRLPSGEQIAEQLELDDALVDPVVAKVRDIADAAVAGTNVPSLGAGSPLWLYILAEGEVIGRADDVGGHDPGEGLGPVGARIVAEVLIGLLEHDERSFLGANRNWVPDAGLDKIGDLLATTNWSGLPT